jgi:hypothetical protein
VSEDRTARLPPGYTLDIVGDPCILILRNPDGAVVARFPRNVDPAEIKTSRRRRSLTKGLKTSLFVVLARGTGILRRSEVFWIGGIL